MTEYLVTWSIDLDATSPEAAAEQAEKIMLDPTRMENIFEVYDEDSIQTTVIVNDGVGREPGSETLSVTLRGDFNDDG